MFRIQITKTQKFVFFEETGETFYEKFPRKKGEKFQRWSETWSEISTLTSWVTTANFIWHLLGENCTHFIYKLMLKKDCLNSDVKTELLKVKKTSFGPHIAFQNTCKNEFGYACFQKVRAASKTSKCRKKVEYFYPCFGFSKHRKKELIEPPCLWEKSRKKLKQSFWSAHNWVMIGTLKRQYFVVRCKSLRWILSPAQILSMIQWCKFRTTILNYGKCMRGKTRYSTLR